MSRLSDEKDIGAIVNILLLELSMTSAMLANCSQLLSEEKSLARSLQSINRRPECDQSLTIGGRSKVDNQFSRRSERHSQRADKGCQHDPRPRGVDCESQTTDSDADADARRTRSVLKVQAALLRFWSRRLARADADERAEEERQRQLAAVAAATQWAAELAAAEGAWQAARAAVEDWDRREASRDRAAIEAAAAAAAAAAALTPAAANAAHPPEVLYSRGAVCVGRYNGVAA